MFASYERELQRVRDAITKVESEIEEVKESLKNPNISDDDKAYYRQEEILLMQEENQLRQEENQLRQKELLLIERTRIPSFPQNQQMNSAFLEDLRKDIVAIRESVTKTDRATPQKSPASFGAEELRRLEREGNVYIPNKEGKGEAVLTNEQASSLLQQETEHQVVAFLTPILEAVFQCDESSSNRVLVNCEEYKWLKTSRSSTTMYDPKPDMFVSHKSLYKQLEPFPAKGDDKLLQMRRSTNVFGQLSHWDLRRFLSVVMDVKLKIDHAAFGQTINYAAHLSFEENGPITVRLVLCDRESFWLIETVRGTASSVRQCRWVNSGSKSLLKKFMLEDPVIEILDKACSEFGLVPEENGYLGGGAFGLVFKVRDQNGIALALKIVRDVNDNVTELQKQMAITNEASRKCAHLIVGVEDNSFRKFDELGAVLLFSEVGSHYSSLSRKDIIDSLQELHDNHVVHGDARVDNIVCVNGMAKWIDLGRAFFLNNYQAPEMEQKDRKDLMESINRSQYFD